MINNSSDFLICALDFPNKAEALKLVDLLGDKCTFYKVGLELYISEGYAILKELIENRNKKVFLDLKLNDIPKTIERTVKVLSAYGVEYISLFTESPSLNAAKNAIENLPNNRTKLINITVLTSMNDQDLNYAGYKDTLPELLKRRAQMSFNNGADGIVCSAKDLSVLRPLFPQNFIMITPGIRLDNNNDDQKRIATPTDAFMLGASHIVVGRPIKDSQNPKATVKRIFQMCN